MLAYPYPAIRFIQTNLYSPYQFLGDTKLSESTIQDLPPNRIIGFLEVYKCLMHCLIVSPFFLKYLRNAECMISV
jgi:hypothetical protein